MHAFPLTRRLPLALAISAALALAACGGSDHPESYPQGTPMHYALNLRTFIYSHYFYLGLRVAIGLV
ncbi:hypothetical protein, partial [Janthinobacterium sp.]|uniref:hypothetical protein n=1 Tax=Janthinobacterium sp. TaxID=1871054 RepID=UPI0025B80B54